jgi:kinetochore protein Mis12/MTW1
MATSAQLETALLTEHLQYTPLTLMDEIIDTINDLSSRAVDAAEKGLLAANPADLGFVEKAKAEKRSLDKDERGKYIVPEAEGELKDGVHKLETLLQANIDINFDKFEIVALRSILHVPEELVPWVRLEHYNVRLVCLGRKRLLTTFDRESHKTSQHRKEPIQTH